MGCDTYCFCTSFNSFQEFVFFLWSMLSQRKKFQKLYIFRAIQKEVGQKISIHLPIRAKLYFCIQNTQSNILKVVELATAMKKGSPSKPMILLRYLPVLSVMMVRGQLYILLPKIPILKLNSLKTEQMLFICFALIVIKIITLRNNQR